MIERVVNEVCFHKLNDVHRTQTPQIDVIFTYRAVVIARRGLFHSAAASSVKACQSGEEHRGSLSPV